LQQAKIKLDLEFSIEAVCVGLLCAFLLPGLSMIQPLYQNAQVELRDALDVYRRKANEVTVQFTKLENMYGLSFTQLIMGVLFSSYGIIAFVLIPQAILVEESSGKAFFWLMTIFGALVVGLVGIAQLVLPIFAYYLIVIHAVVRKRLCCSSKHQKLRPLIVKNLDSHRHKNQKIGIMIITTVMYMIFVNSFSKQLSGLFFSHI